MKKPVITHETKDSGQRQHFDTGSQRDSRKGKGRYDLVSPLAIRRLALVSERGADKYGDRNWEKGQPISRYVDSAIRHLLQYLEGKRDEDHAGQAAWNLTAILHTEEAINRGLLPGKLYDLPDYTERPDPPCCEECSGEEDVEECPSCRGYRCGSCRSDLRCECWEEEE